MRANGLARQHCSLAFVMGLFWIVPDSFAQAPENNQRALTELGPLLVEAAEPLNRTLEVNAGGFGARDPMEMPMAIQSYGAGQIADQSARTLMDVLALDSSVSGASLGSSFDSFSLRGFAMDNFTTIRRDGLALAPYNDAALENIERIDVLKGPSGFLYGLNSPGGTVNYVLKRPTQKSFSRVTLQGSSLLGRYVAVDASDSTRDGRFGYRFNTAYEDVGNFSHAGDLTRRFIGVATDARLSERALLQLNADWSTKSVVADPLLRADQSGRANRLDPASYVRPPRVDRRDLLTGSWFRYINTTTNLDAKLEFELGSQWSHVVQANYSHMKRDEAFNDLFDIRPDGAIQRANLYSIKGERMSAASLQSYLAGNFATGIFEHEVFMGGSVRRLEGRTPEANIPSVDLREDPGADIGQVSVVNVRDPVAFGKYPFASTSTSYRMNTRENALFASDLVTLNEHFQVLLGGRYIWYRARDLSLGAAPQDEGVLVPAGALIYRPSADIMTYLSYSRGLETGEYAPQQANNANEPTDLIESEQFEIGTKLNLSDSLSVGIALFEIRRDAAYLDSAKDFVADGLSVHRGGELDLSLQVADGLMLRGNAAYLDTELQNVDDPTTRGKRTKGVPRWKGGLGLSYAFAGIRGLSVDSVFHYVGARPVDDQNSGFISSYGLWNAGISYDTRLGSTNATFRLYANNLADKYYYASAYYDGGLQVGRGREVFLSSRFSF